MYQRNDVVLVQSEMIRVVGKCLCYCVSGFGVALQGHYTQRSNNEIFYLFIFLMLWSFSFYVFILAAN